MTARLVARGLVTGSLARAVAGARLRDGVGLVVHGRNRRTTRDTAGLGVLAASELETRLGNVVPRTEVLALESKVTDGREEDSTLRTVDRAAHCYHVRFRVTATAGMAVAAT